MVGSTEHKIPLIDSLHFVQSGRLDDPQNNEIQNYCEPLPPNILEPQYLGEIIIFLNEQEIISRGEILDKINHIIESNPTYLFIDSFLDELSEIDNLLKVKFRKSSIYEDIFALSLINEGIDSERLLEACTERNVSVGYILDEVNEFHNIEELDSDKLLRIVRRERLIELQKLLDSTIGDRSTKHRSYVDANCPIPSESKKVERMMLKEIEFWFRGFDEWFENAYLGINFEEISRNYELDVTDVEFPEHVRPTVEENFEVDTKKNAKDILFDLKEEYADTLVVQQIIEAIEIASTELGIELYQATALFFDFEDRMKPFSSQKAQEYMKSSGRRCPVSASTVGLGKTIKEFISFVTGLESESKDKWNLELLKRNGRNKVKECLVDSEINEKSANSMLILDNRTQNAIAELAKVQERVFSEEDQQKAKELVETGHIFKKACLIFHKLLVDYSNSVIESDPNRRNFTLIPFDEMFLWNESKSKLVPNIRLLKILTNNWVPSIACHARGDIESSDIENGILRARKEHGLLNGKIIRFNRQMENPTQIEFGKSMMKVCPAINVITRTGALVLPKIYSSLINS